MQEPLSRLQNSEVRLQESMSAFQKEVDTLESLPQVASAEVRSQAQGMVCLMSRSAYFDLFVHGTIFEVCSNSAMQEMDQIFQRAMRIMQPDEFRDRVVERHEEFLHFCKSVRRTMKQSLLNAHMEDLLSSGGDSSSDIGIADFPAIESTSYSDSDS